MPRKEKGSLIAWDESASQTFIDYGRYFVPDREKQMEIICDLIPPHEGSFNVLELCCGEGLLAGSLLERYPACTVYGLDGSPKMLERASTKLARYGERFIAQLFDLAAQDWRQPAYLLHAVVSSLAIHHLDGKQKQALYLDVQGMLSTGGVFVIADLVEPASHLGNSVAAKTWDDAVRQQALEIDGGTAFFEIFQKERWNLYRYPDEMDKPSPILDQLKWLEAAGFAAVDVYWVKAGHAIFGGQKL